VSTIKLKITIFSFLFLVFLPSYAASTTCAPAIPLVNLVAEPKTYLNKKVNLEGEFHSFSTLPLDYPKAFRSSKDYIGLVFARPDHKDIPLVELKIAAPLKFFKDNNPSFDHGDILRIQGKVFALALGEPWLEAENIEIIKKNDNDDHGGN